MQLNILIIEDEPAIAENIVYYLNKENITTSLCSTGKTALAAIKKGSFDLVVMDVGLPDMNGFELFKELRKTHDTPVIFLTARSEEIDRIVGLELGADDYITKPFSLRELTIRIRKCHKRQATHRAPEDQTPVDFAIDEARFQIAFQGKALELSRYEYQLLKVLIESPGRVFSRDQLMDKAWSDADCRLDRTVDAHIKNIRQKIHQIDSKADPIVTHRGLGYSLKEGA